MDRDTVLAWAQSVGVEPGDDGFGIIVLAWQAGRRAALEEAAAAVEHVAEQWHGYDKYGYSHAITALIEKEQKP